MARVTAPRTLGICNDYQQLIGILRARIDELRVPVEEVDRVAGLPARYYSKILGPKGGRSLGKVSLGPLLQTLGLELHVVENLDGYARIRSRMETRRWSRKKPPVPMPSAVGE
jgi:hypothetical protein